MSNDVSRLEMIVHFIAYLVVGPIHAILIILILLYLTNYSFVLGLGLLCLFIPAKSFGSKFNDRFRFYFFVYYLIHQTHIFNNFLMIL